MISQSLIKVKYIFANCVDDAFLPPLIVLEQLLMFSLLVMLVEYQPWCEYGRRNVHIFSLASVSASRFYAGATT